MRNKQQLIGLVLASILGGIIALGGYNLMVKETPVTIIQPIQEKAQFSNYKSSPHRIASEAINFVEAAKSVTPGVVHIRTISNGNTSRGQDSFDSFFRDYFGDARRPQKRPQMGTGSGVILSQDGYIVTNNHVVEDADEIEVLLNDNSTYKGKIIGTDPTTDLALIKIEGANFPSVKMGNSDEIEVGEWVLAVGNPFDFRSTVTAGIVSAKGRNINILRDRNGLQIESFIQTDAAVNPGNSGGALVNISGELVGINTAIATPTGTYAGYSFAVPSLLVNKVVRDLKEHGVVQRALLGINIRDVTSELSESEELNTLEGVYVIRVNDGGAAEASGIKSGDVIIAINDEKVKKTAELQEKVALNRPGDRIKVTILREGKEKSVYATLKNTFGTTEVIASNNNFTFEGATFEDVSNKEISRLGLRDGGAKLVDLNNGKWREAGIKEGFIITSIDKRAVTNVEDLSRAMARSRNGVGRLIEGVYPDGSRAYYGIGW